VKKRNTFTLILLALCAASIQAAPKAGTTDSIPTVAKLDMTLFEGAWYELSRIPIPIARDWVNTRDVYIHNSDGSWSVRYEGNKGGPDGKQGVLKQKLRIPDPGKPGEMEVSFIPFVWMKYRLVYMSADSRFMLVTSTSKDLLWLMGRVAVPAQADYDALVTKASALGFDVTRLERVLQTGN